MLFYAYFSVSRKRNIRRNQLEKLFLEGNPPDGLGPHVRRYGRCSRGWGARPLPCGAHVAPPTYSFHPYIPTHPKTSRTEPRSGVPPPQGSVATKNQSGPCSGTLFRHPAGGGSHHRRPSSSSRRYPWRGGSSSPSGLRVCTSSYVFDLSLSRVLSRVPSKARS